MADDLAIPIQSPPIELWEITSTEQLHVFLANELASGAVNSPLNPELKSDGPCDTNLGLKVKRAHISELIHYEDETQGIDTLQSDLPSFQWELGVLSSSIPAGASNGKTSSSSAASDTNYKRSDI